MTDAGGIILHHYDASPFSQKVRMLLALKGLAWRSVVTPNMLPKPDLVPLTGGYRRAPVMQVGADVYLDSPLILDEVERRHPGHAGPADGALNLWADRAFFQSTVTILFGTIGDRVDPRFVADREQLSGRPFDTAAMAAAGPWAATQWRAHLGWVEQALARCGTPFLHGEAPGIADIAAYMNHWFLAGALPQVAADLSAGLSHVARWAAALARIEGGRRTEIDGAAALAEARAAQPAGDAAHDAADPLGLSPGERVVIAADDYGRDPVPGTLVALTPTRMTIARDAGDLGTLHLHAPRIGYTVARA
jgi:glutathione S-transferase